MTRRDLPKIKASEIVRKMLQGRDGRIAPRIDASIFTCPHCGVAAEQKWGHLASLDHVSNRNGYVQYPRIEGFSRALCSVCKEPSLWLNEVMIYPVGSTAPAPHHEMPDHIAAVFNEARLIANLSPRSACALLRLCADLLTIEVGAEGNNLNARIGYISRQQPEPQIQRMLDLARLHGNDAVHPLQIVESDTASIAAILFELMNNLVERLIAAPRRLDDLYSALTSDQIMQIDQRDNKAT